MTGPDLAVFDASDTGHARSDAKLVSRALRGKWLDRCSEKRQEIQERGWELASACVNDGDAKGFAAVTAVCEKMFQADVKRHEQECDDIPDVVPPIVIESRTVVANIDEQKRQLRERIIGTARDGDHSRGDSVRSEPVGSE